MTIVPIAGVRPAAAGTMTKTTGVPRPGGMRRAASLDRAHVIAMTTMTTGAAAVGTAAGSAIPRAIRKPHAAVGKSEAGLDPGTATTMTIAASPAPARATRRGG